MSTGIEWCDETINPQGWGCYGPGGTPEKPQRCWYCYVERQAKGPYVPDCDLCRKLIPHWHPERLEQPLRWRKPRRIFWQSMGDLLHPCSPQNQILAVKDMAKATPQHTHIFCTKNPARYQYFNPWPENCVLLTSITGLGDERGRIDDLLKAQATVRGVSLEPLLGPVILADFHPILGPPYIGRDYLRIIHNPVTGIDERSRVGWLIIGAYTGKGASRFVPAAAWVQDLIDQGRAAGVPIFLKDNLHWPEKIQEWPV
jgi:protein gp37